MTWIHKVFFHDDHDDDGAMYNVARLASYIMIVATKDKEQYFYERNAIRSCFIPT